MFIGLYDVFHAIKNLVKGSYGPLRMREFLLGYTQVNIEDEHPVILLYYASGCLGFATWIFASKLYPYLRLFLRQ